MSIAYFAKQIQPGEKIKKVVYKSLWIFVPQLLVANLLIWAALFFYFWLEKKLGHLANWLTVAVVILGFYIMFQLFMKLKYTAWVITTKRLLDFDQIGFWKNDFNQVDINSVYNPTFVKKGIWATLGNCRTLRVYLNQENAYLELAGVARNKKMEHFFKKNLKSDADYD